MRFWLDFELQYEDGEKVRVDQAGGRRASNGVARGVRKKKEDRWVELLDVAAQVFFEQGYDRTSLQEIADRTGILKGSIYYYIDTKADLLGHILRQAHDAGLRRLAPIASGPGSPVSRLQAMIEQHLRYVCTDRARMAVFVHERERLTEEQRAKYLIDEHAYRDCFERVLREGQESGHFITNCDPQLLSICLLGSLNSVYQWYRPNGKFSDTEIVGQFVQGWLSGVVLHPVR